ncbi:unnamed protein product [marine sediment metagenome]|uniref:ArnR1-like winged helix-turn-helix domain-containing protein n=1 Tax=marine sediment metagenome TaxID=412755 RepID=X1GUD3_9ZZZZ
MVRDSQKTMFTVLREIGRDEKRLTEIMKSLDLSWKSLLPVLDTLLSNGFVKIDESEAGEYGGEDVYLDYQRRKIYHITEEGEKALDTYTDDRVIMGRETNKKWVRHIRESKWALDLLGLEQSEAWCVALDALVRMTEPFTVHSLHRHLDLPEGRMRTLIGELKKKFIVKEYKISFPENWDRLGVGARRTAARKMGLPKGWQNANYLIFDREKFKELIYESVEDRMEVMLG